MFRAEVRFYHETHCLKAGPRLSSRRRGEEDGSIAGAARAVKLPLSVLRIWDALSENTLLPTRADP